MMRYQALKQNGRKRIKSSMPYVLKVFPNLNELIKYLFY